MRYRMIALDLDGTLLDRTGNVSARNIEAVRSARAAGVLVVPCTGRAWRESRQIVNRLPLLNENKNDALPACPGVFVGGAAVCHLHTGQSLDLACIEPELVMDLYSALADLPEAVLVFRDAQLAGHDYLVCGKGHLNASTQWWFGMTQSTVKFQQSPQMEDFHHALRVGVVTTAKRMQAIAESVQQVFTDRVVLQHFAGVQQPDPDHTVHVLEVFAAGVDKWRGLTWIARQHNIDPAHIAVIGDEVNDLAMIQSAGLSIAMGNAIDSVKAAADYITTDCDHHGVAHALDSLLSGKWG